MGITDPVIPINGNELRSFGRARERTGTAKCPGLPAWRKPFIKNAYILKSLS